MSRMSPLRIEETSGKAREFLELLNRRTGRVSNMMATLANAPVALEAYMTFSGVLKQGALSVGEREALALYVGALNHCDYCVAAHRQMAKSAGLSSEEIEGAINGIAAGQRLQTLLTLSGEIVEKRGFVPEAILTSIEASGISKAEILEVIAVVSLNIYTNYLNHFMDPVVDF